MLEAFNYNANNGLVSIDFFLEDVKLRVSQITVPLFKATFCAVAEILSLNHDAIALLRELSITLKIDVLELPQARRLNWRRTMPLHI